MDDVKTILELYLQNLNKDISDKFKIDLKELNNLWNSNNPKNSLVSIDTDNVSLSRLLKCKKDELVYICKQQGKSTKGTKDELIDRLIGLEDKKKRDEKKDEKKEEKEGKKVKKKGKKGEADEKKIIDCIKSKITVVAVRKNKYGNVEHPPTQLVFSDDCSVVIGKQSDEKILNLTPDDIEECKKYNFNYILPTNLGENIIIHENKNLEKFIKDDESDEEAEEEAEEDEDII
jgi:hypothetical protein